MLLEAVLVGGIVAPSWAVAAIAGAALAACFARRAIVVGWVARAYQSEPTLRKKARVFALILVLIAIGLMTLATVLARQPRALALVALVAVCLGLFQMSREACKQGRSLAGELSGAWVLALVAALVILAGSPDAVAAGVVASLLMLKQMVSIQYIRFRLRRSRGQPADDHLLAAVLACAVAVVVLATSEALGWLGASAVLVLLGRACWMHRPTDAPISPARLGITELALGMGYAFCIALDTASVHQPAS